LRHSARCCLGGQQLPYACGRHRATIEAQDIANDVLFLCTEDANYMTGQDLVIDGGMTAGGRPPQRQ
jgi:NAD(P)-dependent dehydrogenase (short-subunit alcohol dehydrogenase family)